MATEIIRKGAGVSRPMNREEYFHIADSDDDYVSELVPGMVVRDPGIMWEHGHLQGKLFRYLDEWMEHFGQGMVSVDCGCILSEDPDTVRFPDVAVLLRQSARDWLHGAPDVAIEVLSPSNTPQGIREKTQDYFNAGALRVWIVDPKARTVLILPGGWRLDAFRGYGSLGGSGGAARFCAGDGGVVWGVVRTIKNSLHWKHRINWFDAFASCPMGIDISGMDS